MQGSVNVGIKNVFIAFNMFFSFLYWQIIFLLLVSFDSFEANIYLLRFSPFYNTVFCLRITTTSVLYYAIALPSHGKACLSYVTCVTRCYCNYITLIFSVNMSEDEVSRYLQF